MQKEIVMPLKAYVFSAAEWEATRSKYRPEQPALRPLPDCVDATCQYCPRQLHVDLPAGLVDIEQLSAAIEGLTGWECRGWHEYSIKSQDELWVVCPKCQALHEQQVIDDELAYADMQEGD